MVDYKGNRFLLSPLSCRVTASPSRRWTIQQGVLFGWLLLESTTCLHPVIVLLIGQFQNLPHPWHHEDALKRNERPFVKLRSTEQKHTGTKPSIILSQCTREPPPYSFLIGREKIIRLATHHLKSGDVTCRTGQASMKGRGQGMEGEDWRVMTEARLGSCGQHGGTIHEGPEWGREDSLEGRLSECVLKISAKRTESGKAHLASFK